MPTPCINATHELVETAALWQQAGLASAAGGFELRYQGWQTHQAVVSEEHTSTCLENSPYGLPV